MLNTTTSKILAIVAVAASVAACQREDFEPLARENHDLANSASFRFYNASLGTARNYLYLNNAPLNGAAVAYGGVFPASAGFYSAVPAGSLELSIRDTSSTAVQPILSIGGNFDAGKRYTIFTYDTATQVKQLTVEDRIEIPNDSTARVRFVNIPFSRQSIPNIDVYSKRRGETIFSGIAPAAVTDFIPYASGQPDTLYVWPTGNNLDTLARLNGFSTARQRSYTLVFRGNYNVAGTGATARTLTSFLTY